MSDKEQVSKREIFLSDGIKIILHDSLDIELPPYVMTAIIAENRETAIERLALLLLHDLRFDRRFDDLAMARIILKVSERCTKANAVLTEIIQKKHYSQTNLKLKSTEFVWYIPK